MVSLMKLGGNPLYSKNKNYKLLFYKCSNSAIVVSSGSCFSALTNSNEQLKNMIRHSSSSRSRSEQAKNQAQNGMAIESTKMRACAHISSVINYNRSLSKLSNHHISGDLRAPINRQSMRRAIGQAEGSTTVEHLIYWTNPHGQNYAQQCTQAGHARQNTKCKSKTVGAMARDIRVRRCGMLFLNFEIVNIACKTVKQESSEWTPYGDEIVDLSKLLQPKQFR